MEKSKVLYVDDELINLQLFTINFGKKYNILTANSGTNGLQILAENPDIRLIISDMKMPAMNGLEFISTIKETRPDAKCYILTGYGLTAEIAACIEKGLIIDCLSKPYDKPRIESAIQDAISS